METFVSSTSSEGSDEEINVDLESPLDEYEKFRINKNLEEYTRKNNLKFNPAFANHSSSSTPVKKSKRRKKKTSPKNLKKNKQIVKKPVKKVQRNPPMKKKKVRRKYPLSKLLMDNEILPFVNRNMKEKLIDEDGNEIHNITRDLIIKKLDYNIRKPTIPLQEAMDKQTTLRLENCKINFICKNLEYFKNNLRVLYLDSNRIRKITEHLAACSKIRYLYLDKNYLTKIENLESLHNLEKLYISQNRIRKLENLGSLRFLSELYIQNQGPTQTRTPRDSPKKRSGDLISEKKKTRSDDSLLSEIETLEEDFFEFTEGGLPPNLRVLDCSGCHIRDIKPLISQIPRIVELRMSNNAIQSIRQLKDLVFSKYELASIHVDQNPVCQASKKWKDQIIMSSKHSLEQINGEEIQVNHREFLLAKQHNKKSRKSGRKRVVESSSDSVMIGGYKRRGRKVEKVWRRGRGRGRGRAKKEKKVEFSLSGVGANIHYGKSKKSFFV